MAELGVGLILAKEEQIASSGFGKWKCNVKGRTLIGIDCVAIWVGRLGAYKVGKGAIAKGENNDKGAPVVGIGGRVEEANRNNLLMW